ncbi:hypothetical protein CWE09_07840 [Aliidiomarina minuta]|uniref:Regulatory signaling modulator protein AmpE n=1 Tax=Aliidiomarina minuta TaxID=880057 RepID=A0A432W905_9GAMM|nr:regulatory signaling modulator protein AmpE [Aliidiomarina minuta]RUO26604.1 hypothetical protein CWE09_07840 [Aliidiomarina minuta]
MVLFSLLLALLAERSKKGPGNWRLTSFANGWENMLAGITGLQRWRIHELAGPLLWIAPSLLLALLLWWQPNTLLVFVINLLVLMVVLGCPVKREQLRQYLKSANRGDTLSCMELQEQLDDRVMEEGPATVGQSLVWLNFRYYFAVAFWFIIFGAPGALGYGLLREREELYPRLLHWVDLIPVRVAGFGYLLVGHFSRAMPAWLGGLFNVSESAPDYLTRVAMKAEDVQAEAGDLTEEPCCLLNLAKRTMMLLLAALAIATLLGWVA